MQSKNKNYGTWLKLSTIVILFVLFAGLVLETNFANPNASAVFGTVMGLLWVIVARTIWRANVDAEFHLDIWDDVDDDVDEEETETEVVFNPDFDRDETRNAHLQDAQVQINSPLAVDGQIDGEALRRWHKANNPTHTK